jgi:Uma2 family endonuclease
MLLSGSMTAAPKLRFTFHEYLLVDEASEARHEYLDGIILGMAGGTPEHARLVAAVVTALSRQLEGKRCAVFSEALRVRSKVTGFAGYPDATIICGSLERDPENSSTATNPAVVVEVLSPSTEDYDRGEKLDQYRQMPSIEHVVLVAHDLIRIDVWSRQASGFVMRSFGPGTTATLPAVDCTLDVDSIYRDPLA